LAVAIATTIYAVFRIYLNGFEKESNNLVIPVIAFVWYYFRKKMYERMKRNQDQG
jgi:hypothetical protein